MYQARAAGNTLELCVCVCADKCCGPGCCPHAETSHSSFTGANSISLKKIVDMFYDKASNKYK